MLIARDTNLTAKLGPLTTVKKLKLNRCHWKKFLTYEVKCCQRQKPTWPIFIITG